MGLLIEQGNFEAVGTQFAAEAEGAASHLPGVRLLNYTVKPPTGLTVMSASRVVSAPTPLSALVRSNMGHVQCAFCLE